VHGTDDDGIVGLPKSSIRNDGLAPVLGLALQKMDCRAVLEVDSARVP
jgi:hypothetical protein